MEVLDGLRELRARMEDPDQVVRDPGSLYEDEGRRACVLGHCFKVAEGQGGAFAGRLLGELQVVNPHANVTLALAAGDHLKIIDAAIAANEPVESADRELVPA